MPGTPIRLVDMPSYATIIHKGTSRPGPWRVEGGLKAARSNNSRPLLTREV